jgi:hypothetical protein
LQELGLPSQIEPFDLEDITFLTEETSPDVRRWAPTTGGCYSTVPTHAFVGIVTVTRLLRRYSCHGSISFIEEGEHD